MDRREMLMGIGSVAALAATSGIAFAAKKEGHEEHHHPAGNKALAMSALECVSTAEAGIRHCIDEMGKGDKSLAECANKMNEVKLVCAALGSLASYDSGYTKEMAKLTARVCEETEKVCSKFDKHKPCMECSESCKKCIEECKKIGA